MPQVTISSSKGLVQTSGSGFTVSDVELVRSSESITPEGARYTISCLGNTFADAANSLDELYFVIYDNDGQSHGVWFDLTGSSSSPITTSDVDYVVEASPTADTTHTATVIAGFVAAAINAHADASAEFEVVDNSDGTLTVYSVYAGEISHDATAEGDSAFTITLTDAGSTDDATIDEDVECTVLNIASDVVDASPLVATLAAGSVVGQRKNLIFVGATAGEVSAGGSFLNGSSAASLLSMTTNTATTHRAVASLVWNGTVWVVAHSLNVTAA
jgi:hypothetical protein